MPSNQNRCIAITIRINNCVILDINVYVPADAKEPIPSSDLFDLRDAVEDIIESVQHYALLLAVDWN